jgi:eukaryotic-like serine/threonine-protein kinase
MRTLQHRYALEHLIGRGATGEVWVGRDLLLCRQVAIKLLRTDGCDEPDARARFAHEARIVAQLRSAHVVQVFDFGEVDAQPFIVMELLEGESLDVRLARHPQLPMVMVARILADVAKGLALTHDAGIVHRDIKPANIFLAREIGREVAKLLDFGVAAFVPRAESGAPSEDGPWVVSGTPLYMSPEQRMGASAGPACDVWALAVVAYQMLSGKCPFDAPNLAELDARVRRGMFHPISELVRGLGPDVDEFFARAFARDASRRFRSASAFVAEFKALIEPAETRRIRLLFIDDEPDMQRLLEHRFRHEIRSGRYELHFALDGEAGLEIVRRLPDIDAVFTDLAMPGADGFAVLSRLPALNPLVRVVVLSAYGDMDNIRAAMNRGAFDFLSKPIDFEDLQHTIHKCVAHVDQLRAALQSREENDLLRALVGYGVVERHLAALRATGRLDYEVCEATVAFIDVARFSRVLAAESPHVVFAHLNVHFEIFLAEVQARGGVVRRFVGDAAMAVFEGPDHLTRAVDACLAVLVRTRNVDVNTVSGVVGTCAATFGVASGLVIAGGAGSADLGHFEHVVLGEPVSTAARLQSIACADEILVAAEAVAKLSGRYALERTDRALERRECDPAAVFRVIGPLVRGHDGADGSRGAVSHAKTNQPRTLGSPRN